MENVANLGELADWIRTGGTMGLLALASGLFIQNRKLKLAEKKDDREGFGALIEALTRDITAVRQQLRECEEEHHRTRNDLEGLRRQFVTYQLAVAQAVPPSRRTPEINAMMTVLEQQQDGEKERHVPWEKNR